MRRVVLAAAGLFLTLAGFAVADQFVPWPSFRHDAQNSGRADYVGADIATVKWTFTAGGQVISSPALGANERIYVGSHDGKLYCLDKAGKQVWSYDTHGTIDFSSPALAADGTIYITAFE